MEQLCDYAAREILVPENAIRKELKLRPLSLKMAVAMAEEKDCDLQVVAQCICDLPGQQDLIFVFCRLNADSVDVLKVVPDSSMTYELGDKGDTLVRRALREKRGIKGDQEVWADGSRSGFLLRPHFGATSQRKSTLKVFARHGGQAERSWKSGVRSQRSDVSDRGAENPSMEAIWLKRKTFSSQTLRFRLRTGRLCLRAKRLCL